MKFREYGWDDYFENHFDNLKQDGRFPGRIIREDRGIYKAVTDSGILPCMISGKMRLNDEFPVTGDWVVMSETKGSYIIHGIIPRKTFFSRKEAGKTGDRQILAANMDFVFIMTSMNANFNVRRIERYLVLAKESGALPVIILSKADLAEDKDVLLSEVRKVASGSNVILISAKTGFGMEELSGYLTPGLTIAIFGSSGVGKSTLINRLLGEEALRTNEVRECDEEGRHTTTWRELVMLPCGAMIVDTPGLREVGISDVDGIDGAFEDIMDIASGCKFRDCSHMNEPGCAVIAALDTGELDRNRYDSFLKLRKENDYFASRDDISAKLKEKQKRKKFSKMQKRMKENGEC
jgi:ribosome biogenesis GTPase / thiamine phosphate phosphatase